MSEFPTYTQAVRIINLEIEALERKGWRQSDPVELSDDGSQLRWPLNNAHARLLVEALARMSVVAIAVPVTGELTRSWVQFPPITAV